MLRSALILIAFLAVAAPIGAHAQPVGSEFQVNTYTTGYQHYSSVATDSDGDFVVVWSSDGQDGNGGGAFGKRYTSAGAAVGGEFQVNTYTTGGQGGFPDLAMNSDGDFVVTWQSLGQDQSFLGIFGQRYTSAGTAVGSEFQVNTYTTQSQNYGTVAMDDDGDFVVTWSSQYAGQDGSHSGVFAQRFEFMVVTTTTSTTTTSITVPTLPTTTSTTITIPPTTTFPTSSTTSTSTTSTSSPPTTSSTLPPTTILGKRFVVKDPRPTGHPSGADPDKRQVQVLGKEIASPDAVLGDPIANGATLEIIANGTSPTQQTVIIPPGLKVPGPTAGWKAISGGFKYVNPTSTGAGPTPVKSVLIKKTPAGTFLLKVKLQAKLQGNVDVVPPAPGTDGGLIFTIPGGATYCVNFGGAAGGAVVNAPPTGALQYLQTFKITSTLAAPTNEGAGCP